MPAHSPSGVLEELRALLKTPEMPELGPGPRASVLSLPELDQKLAACLGRSALPSAVHQPIRALVFLWHDHLDSSHRISQDLHGQDGSFLHGIMHRREPDYGNAKYWFQRVGRHDCFPQLASKATALLGSKAQEALRKELAPGGDWDPFAFIDACEKAADRPGNPQLQLLREIQAAESQILLEKFGRSAA